MASPPPPMREAVVQKLLEGIQKGCRAGVNETFLDDLRSRTQNMDGKKGPTGAEVEEAIRLFREHADDSRRNSSSDQVTSSDYSSREDAPPPAPSAPPAPGGMPRPINPGAGVSAIPPPLSTNSSSNSGYKLTFSSSTGYRLKPTAPSAPPAPMVTPPTAPPPPAAIPAAPARPPAPPTSNQIGGGYPVIKPPASPLGLPPSLEQARGASDKIDEEGSSGGDSCQGGGAVVLEDSVPSSAGGLSPTDKKYAGVPVPNLEASDDQSELKEHTTGSYGSAMSSSREICDREKFSMGRMTRDLELLANQNVTIAKAYAPVHGKIVNTLTSTGSHDLTHTGDRASDRGSDRDSIGSAEMQMKRDEQLALAMARSDEAQIIADEELARRLQAEFEQMEQQAILRQQAIEQAQNNASPSAQRNARQGGVTMVTGRPVANSSLQVSRDYRRELARGVEVWKISSQGVAQKRTLTLLQGRNSFKLGAFLRSRIIPFATIQYVMEGCAMSQAFALCYRREIHSHDPFCCSLIADDRRFPLRFGTVEERNCFLTFCRSHFTVCEAPGVRAAAESTVSPNSPPQATHDDFVQDLEDCVASNQQP